MPLTMDRIETIFQEVEANPDLVYMTEDERADLDLSDREAYNVHLLAAKLFFAGQLVAQREVERHFERLAELRQSIAVLNSRGDLADERARVIEARLREETDRALHRAGQPPRYTEGLVGDPEIVAAAVRGWQAEFGSSPDHFDLTIALARVLDLDLTDEGDSREIRDRIDEAIQMTAISATYSAPPARD